MSRRRERRGTARKRHQDEKDDVREETDAAEQGEDDEDGPDEGGIDREVLGDAAAHPGYDAIRVAALKTWRHGDAPFVARTRTRPRRRARTSPPAGCSV